MGDRSQDKLGKLIIDREYLVARTKLGLYKLDLRINRIILREELTKTKENVEKFKQGIKQLKDSPSIAEYGKGGYLAELERQLDISKKVNQLRKEAQKQREDRRLIQQQLKELGAVMP